MLNKMKTLEETKEILKKTFGEECVIEVDTENYDLTTNPSGRNHKADRRKWADKVVYDIYNHKEREKIVKKKRSLGSGEFSFSYIKFAINERNEIFAVVHGKSSFHCMYPSDVWFYDFDNDRKLELKQLFVENNLSWFKDKIIIVKNLNDKDYHEAYAHEKEFKELLNTYD